MDGTIWFRGSSGSGKRQTFLLVLLDQPPRTSTILHRRPTIWTAFSCTIRASTLPSRDHRYIHLLQLEGSTPLTCHQTQLLLWLRVQLAAVTTNTINLRKLQYPQHRGMSIIKLSPTPASPAICRALTASASAKSGFHTIKPHPA